MPAVTDFKLNLPQHCNVKPLHIKQIANINVTIKCLVLEFQLILFQTSLDVILGKRQRKVSAKWREYRTTEWNSDLIVGCVSPGRPVSSFQQRSETAEPRAVVNGGSGGWSRWKPLVNGRPHNYPPIPFSWFIFFLFPNIWVIIVYYRQTYLQCGNMDGCVRRMNSSVGRHGLSCGPLGTCCRLWAVFK